MGFTFQNLDVYKEAVRLAGRIDVLAMDLKGKASYSLLDQMTRAALSIPLNIAEGNGRWHKNDKKNFFWIARGSAFELVPLIELLHQKSLIGVEERETLMSIIERIAMMLTKLAQSIEWIRKS